MNSSQINLSQLLKLGLSFQLLEAVISFAAQNGKEEFIKTISQTISNFIQTLNDKEKKDLYLLLEENLKIKAKQVVDELDKNLDEAGIDEALKALAVDSQ